GHRFTQAVVVPGPAQPVDHLVDGAVAAAGGHPIVGFGRGGPGQLAGVARTFREPDGRLTAQGGHQPPVDARPAPPDPTVSGGGVDDHGAAPARPGGRGGQPNSARGVADRGPCCMMLEPSNTAPSPMISFLVWMSPYMRALASSSTRCSA